MIKLGELEKIPHDSQERELKKREEIFEGLKVGLLKEPEPEVDSLSDRLSKGFLRFKKNERFAEIELLKSILNS